MFAAGLFVGWGLEPPKWFNLWWTYFYPAIPLVIMQVLLVGYYEYRRWRSGE